MNARESLAADRYAENAQTDLEDGWARGSSHGELCSLALTAIAAELRAARVYANYLEGRNPRMRGGKDTPSQNDAQPEEFRA
jgi:hypothetical protein